MKLINLFLIIFVVIILIYSISCNTNSISNKLKHIDRHDIPFAIKKTDFLNGYWTSDSDFAKLSKIDEMILNIDMDTKKGFLIIIVDNKIVSNDEFDILLNKKCNEIEFVSDNIKFIWNEKKFNIDMSLKKGSISLLYNNTIYASLFKDNKMSQVIN